jgi:hypothetical protein
MKTTVHTFKVYSYDELSEEAKDRAAESLYSINVDGEWWDYESKTGFSQGEVKTLHQNGLALNHEIPAELIDHDKIYFDLDRSAYIQLVNPRFSDDEVARCFCGVNKRIWGLLESEFYSTGRRDGDTRVVFSYCGRQNPVKAIRDAIERAEERINGKIQQVLIDLQTNFNYLVSREAIEDTIRANEYEFTEDGKLF